MRAMIFEKAGKPMELKEIPMPEPSEHQVLLKVHACGVCRTDLHIVDAELDQPKVPLVLGHQIVGTVEKKGSSVDEYSDGDRVGVPWLGGSCQQCSYCKSGKENLCDKAVYTGYQINGGFAEYCVADARYCFPIPTDYPDLQAAPLLCAGLIGYRSLRFCGDAKKIGFYGFGAAANILIQVAKHKGQQIYAFTKKGDVKTQEYAKKMGAVWAGDSETLPPEPLEAAIIFAPIGPLIPIALQSLAKGGSIVCAGIHMSDIPSFPYSILWGERLIRSVANLTRKDGEEFLDIAPKVPIKTEATKYPLEKLNEALDDLREGRITGSAVIVP